MEESRKEYRVKSLTHPLHIQVEVPGSKSMTNRALLMAAMADGNSVLEGVLFSDDSEFFLQALQTLGFSIGIDRGKKRVKVSGSGGKIPKKSADIFVGSAGTAARFLTAFLAMCDGKFRLDASEQMRKRPMKELLLALETLGVKISYEKEKYHFPFTLTGLTNDRKEAEVSLNIDRSSQFLSALLLAAPLRISSLKIRLTGKRNARSYVEMTEQMMKQFGHDGVKKVSENVYEVTKSSYQARHYEIEPDVSAACYFYAMAAVTGGSALVKRMREDSLQGDMRFLAVLEKMGCTLMWEPLSEFSDDLRSSRGEIISEEKNGVKRLADGKKELVIKGPAGGKLLGVEESFSDFSDQALTAAAIAPFAGSPVAIKGIAHIRGQESDRIAVIVKELGRMGIRCEEQEDGIIIYPGKPEGARIRTYEDHRVAMSFAITGLRTEGIIIENPDCCKKTFPEYFEILNKICSDGNCELRMDAKK